MSRRVVPEPIDAQLKKLAEEIDQRIRALEAAVAAIHRKPHSQPGVVILFGSKKKLGGEQ